MGRRKRARSRRGLAATSERAYRQDWNLLAARILTATGRPADSDVEPLAQLRLADLTDANLKAVISALEADGYTAASRARMLSAWRGLCRWLVENGHLPVDPTERFHAPALGDQLPVAFGDTELARILAAAADPPDRDQSRAAWPTRDIALVAILAGTGLRVGELCSLTVGDIDRDTCRIRIRKAEGHKQRVVPISTDILTAIDRYQTERAARGRGGTRPRDRVFVRTDGKAFITQAVDWLIHRWLTHAAVPHRDGAAAHAFRHTYAVGQLDWGTPLPQLSTLLGHGKLETTARYLRVSTVELQQTAQTAPGTRLLRNETDQPRT